MSRTERFALGIALMTTALAVILKRETLAWFLFCIGLSFVVVPLLLDWRYGTYRPTYKQIEEMSAADYKKLLLNPKSRRWIDLLDRWKTR
jgi:hypothetical protein